MIVTIVVSIIVCLAMISCILFFPAIHVGKIKLDTYWIVTLLGAVAVLLCSPVGIRKVGEAFIADTAVNPLKILILFLSMTILSVFLDELGFFELLANAALRRAGTKQIRLFFILYVLVSVLTVFTSNDIIILSFTPFICYFTKSAKINPIPYLATEFVAANTWSMALIIGNPTNIYLATAAGINFTSYIRYAVLPTLLGGGTALAMLFALFCKHLRQPIVCKAQSIAPKDTFLLWVGIAHLAIATVFLAIGSYIGIEMWFVASCSSASLLVFSALTAAVRRKPPRALLGCIKRIPYQLIPFMLSMFVIVVTLDCTGVTEKIGSLLGSRFPIAKYGILSFLSANIVNNIPMSVLFSSVISSTQANLKAVFATIIGSNVCAFLTPIGALAGILWSSVIGKHGIRFGYVDFLKIGIAVAVPTLCAALFGLWITFAVL